MAKAKLTEVDSDGVVSGSIADAVSAKEPKTEDDIIWLAVSSLRNRAKKLSPEGRQKLFVMVRGFVG